MADYKTVAVTPEAHVQLEKLATRFKLSHKALITEMVQYFTATKLDPRHSKNDTIDVALKKMTDKIDGLDKRVIGFHREQEKTLIKPMLSEVKATRADISKLKSGANGAAGLTRDDLDQLSEGLQQAIFHLLGRAIHTNSIDPIFLEQYNKAVEPVEP